MRSRAERNLIWSDRHLHTCIYFRFTPRKFLIWQSFIWLYIIFYISRECPCKRIFIGFCTWSREKIRQYLNPIMLPNYYTLQYKSLSLRVHNYPQVGIPTIGFLCMRTGSFWFYVDFLFLSSIHCKKVVAIKENDKQSSRSKS